MTIMHGRKWVEADVPFLNAVIQRLYTGIKEKNTEYLSGP